MVCFPRVLNITSPSQHHWQSNVKLTMWDEFSLFVELHRLHFRFFLRSIYNRWGQKKQQTIEIFAMKFYTDSSHTLHGKYNTEFSFNNEFSL